MIVLAQPKPTSKSRWPNSPPASKPLRKKETDLGKQVKGLQADLDKQQERLFELKDILEQAQKDAKADADKLQKVTKELEEAKSVILKMTEAAEATPASAPVPAPPEPTPAAPELETKPALAVKMPPGGGDIYRGRRLPSYKSSGGRYCQRSATARVQKYSRLCDRSR